MAEHRPLRDYPEEFTRLFMEGARRRIAVSYPSYEEAFRVRERLYAFRRAVLEYDTEIPELTLCAPMVRLSIVPVEDRPEFPFDLVLEPSVDANMVKKLREVLDND